MAQQNKLTVLVAGISQETNTFCPCPTGIDLFERGYYLRGDDIPSRLAGTNTEIGGFYGFFAEEPSVKVTPGIAAWAVASGRITNEAFDALLSDLLDTIEQHLPVDGVLLALHGALVSEDLDDCEGHLIEAVRRLVGKDIPIVCTLDYHACVTKKMVETADLLIGYRTYPHIDYRETGEKAAAAILGLIREKYVAHPSFEKLPMILPVENTETADGPMKTITARLETLDADPDIVSASLFCPHPWLDVEDIGTAVLVYTRESPSTVQRFHPHPDPLPSREREQMVPLQSMEGEWMVAWIWERRKDFFLEFPSVSDFLDSVAQYQRPIIVVDSGDITSAGGVGDSTVILRALLERDLRLNAALQIVDPDSVSRAVDLGEGSAGEFRLGGGDSSGYNLRTPVTAEVVTISESTVEVKGESFSGLTLDMGRRALLRINRCINVVLCEHKSLFHDPEILRTIGVEPGDCDIIVQKSHKLFRSAYKDIARSIVVLDTPGCTSMNVRSLPYERVRRPVYPLDEI